MNTGEQIYNIAKLGKIERTDEINNYLRELNKILFNYNKKYINSIIKDKILNKTIQIGKAVSNTDVKKQSCQQAKNTLLEQIRDIYKNIRDYQPELVNNECRSKSYNYQISNYLRQKDNLTAEKILELLNSINATIDDWNNEEVPTSLIKAKKELILKLADIYNVEV